MCRTEENTKRTTKVPKWTCNLTPLIRNICWKYCGKGEKLLLRSNFSPYPQYFFYLMLDFYVETGIRVSLRDKRLFEITEVEITRVTSTVLSLSSHTSLAIKKISENRSIREALLHCVWTEMHSLRLSRDFLTAIWNGLWLPSKTKFFETANDDSHECMMFWQTYFQWIITRNFTFHDNRTGILLTFSRCTNPN